MQLSNVGITIVILGVLSCFFAVNCQTTRRYARQPTPESASKALLQRKALNEFTHEFAITAGKVTLLHFPYHGPFSDEALMCNGDKIPFFVLSDQNEARAFFAPSYFYAGKDFACKFVFKDPISSEGLSAAIGKMVWREYRYPQEVLNVDEKRVILSKKDEKRAKEERSLLDDIFKIMSETLLINEPFSPPLLSKITSIYGTQRVFNNQRQSQHLGTDFRAKIGTEVKAANRGTVVFAGNLFYGGNTVVLDHGLGIFTSYSHLSKIYSQVGQQVTNESILGLSGMTGRVNGPHLHWGAKVNGNWVDGDSLVEASKTHFSQMSKEIVVKSGS
jgi:murein DD-endopeptidase MepM/ murein hydrolase activator NlpD